MIKFKHKGDFEKTERFLTAAQKFNIKRILESYGWEGVKALSAATPMDTGVTAASWGYKVSITKSRSTLTWYNTNVENGALVAILIQYGHGTRNGGYVRGIDYINPAIKPIFDKIAESAWEEVSNL